jgi:hypothetical protein
LTTLGIMRKRKIGRDNYYLNGELVALLSNVQALGRSAS